MTINVNSLWVVVGIGVALGFGVCFGVWWAFAFRCIAEWLGARVGDGVIWLINRLKSASGKEE